MKTYLYLITLVSFLCWTSCANKNVTAEDTQELSSTPSAETYNIAAATSSICNCLDEKAKTNTTNTNLTVKSACQKQAYTQHGMPPTKAVKVNIHNTLKKECPQYLIVSALDNKTKNKTFQKKEAAYSKKGKTKNGKKLKGGQILLKEETE